MKSLPRILVTVLPAVVILCATASAAAKGADLERWIEGELLPYVNERIARHPRFKGETLLFVVLDRTAPAPVSNVLALTVRDRLLDAALQTQGVRIGWRQSGTDRMANGPVDCSRDDVHYYVGVELSRRIDGRHELRVRALDLEERNWVSGFGTSWRGSLNKDQLRALRRSKVDPYLLGARDAPFSVAQSDLLAQRLAHELSCSLLRQTNGDYVVPALVDATGEEDLAAAIELISNNIAAQSAFEVTQNDAEANAELTGKAHRIDGDLYQYWLSVTPKDSSGDLETLAVSAYVRLPELRRLPAPPAFESEPAPSHAVRTPAPLALPNARDDTLIGPLRVVTPAKVQQCGSSHSLLRTANRWDRGQRCSLLAARLHADAVVFVLEHQPQLGLVRLGGNECRMRTAATVVRKGDRLSFPIARFRADTGRMRGTDAWQRAPELDTYYAVAVADSRSARRLANHIDRLPVRCGEASRPGLKDSELEHWLDEFELLAAQSATDFGWRALELKDVY